jgi:signal transduction histidine kinase
MRLADFIVSSREAILKEWETFASTCEPACVDMDITALRDHADEMLTVIVKDLNTPQGPAAQADKSKGLAPESPAETTAAEDHGSDRAESGFSVEQMISEYRALRASVLRLWTRDHGPMEAADLIDVTRFNEAIDQALAESIQRYTQDLGHSKEMFLAMLGHDLRTPLGAITTAARFMLDTSDLVEPHLTLTSRIASSSVRMVGMVGDLLDFTRSRLGGGIPVVRAEMCMDEVVHDVVGEIATSHPGREIVIDARGNQRGEWDASRISQALANLLGNALEHGGTETPVNVVVGGADNEITVAVQNRGRTIPRDKIAGLFNPMKVRESLSSAAGGQSDHLGLGLYIAERIVHAHKGLIRVTSTDGDGTTFTMHLPRMEPHPAALPAGVPGEQRAAVT